jgi:hypothetical protein
LRLSSEAHSLGANPSAGLSEARRPQPPRESAILHGHDHVARVHAAAFEVSSPSEPTSTVIDLHYSRRPDSWRQRQGDDPRGGDLEPAFGVAAEKAIAQANTKKGAIALATALLRSALEASCGSPHDPARRVLP